MDIYANVALLWSEDVCGSPNSKICVKHFGHAPKKGEFILSRCRQFAYEVLGVEVKDLGEGAVNEVVLSARSTKVERSNISSRSIISVHQLVNGKHRVEPYSFSLGL